MFGIMDGKLKERIFFRLVLDAKLDGKDDFPLFGLGGNGRERKMRRKGHDFYPPKFFPPVLGRKSVEGKTNHTSSMDFTFLPFITFMYPISQNNKQTITSHRGQRHTLLRPSLLLTLFFFWVKFCL